MTKNNRPHRKVDVVKEVEEAVKRLKRSFDECPYGALIDEYKFITDPNSDLTEEVREAMLDRWMEKSNEKLGLFPVGQ